MKIKVGVSARHAHLTKETYFKLFGHENISKKNDLNQIGEFASNETLIIKTEKNMIEKVRVLGPFRDYDQVEISRTDAINLGINPPVRRSGNIDNTPGITLIGSLGTIILGKGVIIAERHIHMSEEMALKYNLQNNSLIKVIISGTKGILKDEVKEIIYAFLKISANAYLELHIDTDDANALALQNGDEVEIEI